MTTTTAWKLTDDVYEGFRALIESHSGLHLNLTDRHLFEQKVIHLAKSRRFRSLQEYVNFLRFDPQGERAISPLVDLTTNNETYFFREPAHFKLLKNALLPKFLKEGPRQIKIWSAGSSTGEEPYTIAISIKEYMDRMGTFPIQIIATDIDMTALKRATKAHYNRNSFRGVDPAIIDQYFVPEKGDWILKDEIRNMVDFRHLNQVNGEYPAGDLVDVDIIFYRNVSIYFDPETNHVILHKLFDTLREGGFLIPGTTETMQYRANPFALREGENVFYLEKTEEKAVAQRPANPGIVSMPAVDIKLKPPKLPAAKVVKDVKVVDDEPMQRIVSLKQAIELLNFGRYDEAALILNALIADKMNEEDALLLLANMQFNRGELQTAEEIIRRLLAVNDIRPEAFLLLGMIKKSSGDMNNARQMLQKALFLQANMWVANYHLAEIHRLSGNIEQARREYSNTLKKLKRESEHDWTLYMAGFSKSYLVTVCEKNLQALQP